MKNLLLLLLFCLVLSGCSSGSAPQVTSPTDTEQLSTSTTETVSNNSTFNATGSYSVLNNAELSNISVGDFTAKIPSSWSNNNESYYLNKKGEPPYIYFHLDPSIQMTALINNHDSYIDGTMRVFDNSVLTSDFTAVKYANAEGYAFSFNGSIKGYDTTNTFTFFDNPSGGVVIIGFADTGNNHVSQYLDVLNTVYTDVPFSTAEPSAETAFDEKPDSESSEKPSNSSKQISVTEIDNQATNEDLTNLPTPGEQNALASAKRYINYSPFSYSGLIDQLKYEGFTDSEAAYGADNCGADWYEQALKSAEKYLNYSAFSYSGLIEQLEYEGYTEEEASYGVDNCGADWNEQAAKKAQQYLDYSSFSRSGLIDQLEYEGFTPDQAEYGVSQVYN